MRIIFLFTEKMKRHVHAIPGDTYRKVDSLPESLPLVKGYNFNQGVDYRALLKSYLNTGLQATNVGVAIQLINAMVGLPETFCQPCNCSNWNYSDFFSPRFYSNAPVMFSTRRSKNEKSPLKVWRMMRSIATASSASPSISATHLISSAAESGRASATWRSTRWCGCTPLCDCLSP